MQQANTVAATQGDMYVVDPATANTAGVHESIDVRLQRTADHLGEVGDSTLGGVLEPEAQTRARPASADGEAVIAYDFTPSERADYAGTFYSAELDVTYRLFAEGEGR